MSDKAKCFSLINHFPTVLYDLWEMKKNKPENEQKKDLFSLIEMLLRGQWSNNKKERQRKDKTRREYFSLKTHPIDLFIDHLLTKIESSKIVLPHYHLETKFSSSIYIVQNMHESLVLFLACFKSLIRDYSLNNRSKKKKKKE